MAKLKNKIMKTSEKFLASSFFVKLIRLTFGINVVRIRKTIPALTKWYSFLGNEDYLCYASNRIYEVYAYSIKDGFKKLDVVHTIDYYSGEEGFSSSSSTERHGTKYYNLVDALIGEKLEPIFIVVTADVWGSDGEGKHVTVYEVPNLTKYLKK